jgi:dipeptidyl aminopeptidase/acylaminoacyl peptidase
MVIKTLHTKEMRKALEKAGKDVAWLQLDTAGHGIEDEDDRATFYKRMLSSLGEHIQ